MTNTQKALRGIGNYSLLDVKPKVGRRLARTDGLRYRTRFLNKQALNMRAAAKRNQQRAEEARRKEPAA